MKTPFTPGPWEWYGPTRYEGLTFTHEAHVGPGDGNDSCGPIAAVSGDDDEQAVANARLIAAAPDLLAACERLLACLDSLDGYDYSISPDTDAASAAAAAAVRKARGGT